MKTKKTFLAACAVALTAVQEQKGRYINSTYYNWTLTCQVLNEQGGLTDSVVTKQYHTNYDGISNADPQHTFAIPQGAQGRATISFYATYNYSSDGILVWDGSNIGDNSSFSGYITSTSSLLSGDSRGSFNFYIQ